MNPEQKNAATRKSSRKRSRVKSAVRRFVTKMLRPFSKRLRISDSAKPHQEKTVAGQSSENWEKLVRECVNLHTMIERSLSGFDESRRSFAELIQAQIEEMLERSGVTTIWGETTFSPQRHLPERPNDKSNAGDQIIQTVSPGFAVNGTVFRKARVRLS